MLISSLVIIGLIGLAESYTKYGRSCKDIGCPSSQTCVMETDPCSYYQRQGECGSYPTCKRISSDTARTCATYVCPPTKVCKMDDGTPKCVDDHSKVGLVGYDTHSQNTLDQQVNPGQVNPQPNQGGNLYPGLPRSRGETTPRPNTYRQPAQGGGGGYQGGQVGSGYPGQGGSMYPQQQGGGYPQQGGGYPQQQGGYPQQGGGYPQQQGGYPQQGYNGGYPGQQYPGQGGYQQPPQGGYRPPQGYPNQYGQKSSGNSFTDQISNSLKTIGLFCIILKYLY